jgi:hypothetical protein
MPFYNVFSREKLHAIGLQIAEGGEIEALNFI